MKSYDHKQIEKRWQKEWEKKKANIAEDKVASPATLRGGGKPKFYSLIEFPFLSGEGLHVGHIRSYTALDIVSRKRRAEGANVLYPIGYDAFGLPIENFAIKTGKPPALIVKNTAAIFRRQLKALGFSFDWSREVNTSDPGYYKWTQWIFLKFLERGLAYKKKMTINWCPKDKIGLANEEVVEGKCERCGTPVEKREKEQWMLAITKYAERLDRDLEPKKILIGTRNPAKAQMIRSALAGVSGIELVSLDDLPTVDDSALAEGEDFKENARRKSEFYFKKTGIPTIGSDNIFWIEKWPENGGFMVHMRKHANPASSRATDEEVLTFFKNFLKKVGGQSKAGFHYSVSYTDERGTVGVEPPPYDYILQEVQAKSYAPGYPTEALLKDAETGVFKSNQGDEVRYGKLARAVKEKLVPRMTGKDIGIVSVDYLDRIKLQQKNWIGRSEGVNFKGKVKDLDITVEMYNSVPQTYRAETFTVIAPEHNLVSKLVAGTKYEKPVLEFVEQLKRKRAEKDFDAEKEMEGIFTGRYIENYAGTGRDLPIWIASYVVADYGTGIVNASAHDERDYKFAKKFSIPLHPVAEPLFVKTDGVDAARKDLPFIEREAITAIVKHWSEDKYIGLKWKKVDWDTFITGGVEKGQNPEEAARAEITEETGYRNMKLVRTLPRAHSQFFHVPKNENRFAHFNVFFFQLTDGEKREVSADEQLKHDVVWLTPKELETFRLPESHRLAWEQTCGIEKAVVKNGILLEPAEFKGREWHEVRPDIINYLVEKGYATRAVNYKLRDWVFSRQRYWGEPIPVVHCEKCGKKKYNFVLIHGRGGSKDSCFFPELKRRLVESGHSVFAENLPVAAGGLKIDEQVDFLLKRARFDRNTVIIAHSAGGLVAHKLLPCLEGKIHKVIFVDSFVSSNFTDRPRPDLEKSTDWKFDFKKARAKVEEVVVLGDSSEATVPKSENLAVAKAYGVEATFARPTLGHFRGGDEPIVFASSIPSSFISVPEKYLPVKLPKVKNYKPTDTGESPLAAISKWVNVKCPVCKGPAKRETDTMPNWAGSSWYYLAYAMYSKLFPKSKVKGQWSNVQLEAWLPVDWYNGGMEHTTLHLLYSRFWHKFLYDLGLVPTNEPYAKRTSHGLILGKGGVKMSKSVGNVVNPDVLIKTFGADTLRLYEMFMGPFDQHIAWSTEAMAGPRRFLEKVWRLFEKTQITNHKLQTPNKSQIPNSKLETLLHKTIKKVSEDIEAMRFNTAVSAMMMLTNEFEKAETIEQGQYEIMLRLLAPFAPHITEELWSMLDHPPSRGGYGRASKKSIHIEPWPVYDAAIVAKGKGVLVIQVNGKVRANIETDGELLEIEAKEKALALPEIQKWIGDRPVRKFVYVRGRLLNIVV